MTDHTPGPNEAADQTGPIRESPTEPRQAAKPAPPLTTRQKSVEELEREGGKTVSIPPELTRQLSETIERLNVRLRPVMASIRAFTREYRELLPYLDAELEKPKYKGMRLEEVYDLSIGPEPDEEILPDSLFMQALNNARAARAAASRAADQESDDHKSIDLQLFSNEPEAAGVHVDEADQGQGQETPAPEATPAEETKQASALVKAQETGAITTLKYRLTSFSSKDMQQAFTGHKIFFLPSDNASVGDMFNEAGQLDLLNFKSSGQKITQAATNQHTAFLMTLARMAYISFDGTNNFNMTFYAPTICRELKLDPRKYSTKRGDNKLALRDARRDMFITLIRPLERMVGVLPNGSIYRVVMFSSYDNEEDTITLSAPYLFKLVEIAMRNKGEPLPLNSLLHSSVTNERNHAAVELANRIIIGLLRRGTVPGGSRPGRKKRSDSSDHGRQPVVYRTRYSSLIEDCPMLQQELAEIDANQAQENKRQIKNTKLKRVFEKAYEILRDQSDLFEYYNDLQFEPLGKKTGLLKPPTVSTLNQTLFATHYGRNEKYQSL